MKLQLKNCKINLTFSEETIMFKADVYIDGKKCGYAENDGRGGSTWVTPYPDKRQTISDAQKYFDSLPMITTKYADQEYKLKQSLELAIDEIVYDMVNKKEEKKFKDKMNKSMQKGLVVSNDNLKSYKIVSWKKFTITDLLKTPNGQESIKRAVQKCKQDGYAVYNTNIPTHILN